MFILNIALLTIKLTATPLGLYPLHAAAHDPMLLVTVARWKSGLLSQRHHSDQGPLSLCVCAGHASSAGREDEMLLHHEIHEEP